MTWEALEKLLAAALSRRATLKKRLSDDNTTAYRLFSGRADGLEKLVIEVFDSVAVLQIYEAGALADPVWKRAAEWLIHRKAATSVYAKVFEPERFRAKVSESVPLEPLAGPAVPSEITCCENELKFIIRPYEGLSSGLFLDQRENRKLLAQMSAGEKVLNGFSYTCAFSVACAAQAAVVTSVDVSKKALEWGKRNFALNDLDITGHKFYADDIFEFYQRANKRRDRFDVIILDPPSFSRTAKGKPFSVHRDWRKLLEGAASLLEPRGTLFFSSNLSRWDSKFLSKMVRDALEGFGRKGKAITVPKPPEDFGSAETLSAVLFQLAD